MSIIRAALYERVSTEEQVLHGFSLEAQKDNLEEYCHKHDMKIVRHYTDEGISGAKPPMKRPALKSLLDDVQAGKVDMILFVKLDRWFRSVKEYFKVQEILDSHKVEWKAIFEDYDTTTANGRMAITIFLAVAQNERERTSERIKMVLDNKRSKGICCHGGKKPFGYRFEMINGVRRLVKDESEADAVQAFFAQWKKSNCAYDVTRYMYENFGILKTYQNWIAMRKNTLYCGTYKGYANFCDPYITRDEYDLINSRPNIRKANHTYIFPRMIVCPICGKLMRGRSNSHMRSDGTRRYSKFYECRAESVFGKPDHAQTAFEMTIEKYLIENLETLIGQQIIQVSINSKQTREKPKVDVSALEDRLRRIRKLYIAGDLSDAEYKEEADPIKRLIDSASTAEDDPGADLQKLQALQNSIPSNFRELYSTFSDDEKRRFWSSIVKTITVKDHRVDSVIFFNRSVS